MANLQREIDDTVGIMQKNIEGMAERGEHLQTLQQKTGRFSLVLGPQYPQCVMMRCA
jgi:hypothetical protein